MFRTNKLLALLFLVIFMLAYTGCNPVKKEDKVAIARLVNGVPELIIGEAKLKTAFENAFADSTAIHDVKIEKFNNSFFIIGSGDHNGDSRLIGFKLELDDQKNLNAKKTTVTHICTGVNCEKCEFTRDNDGNIDGCDDCKRAGDHPTPPQPTCNHSVSESTTKKIIKAITAD